MGCLSHDSSDKLSILQQNLVMGQLIPVLARGFVQMCLGHAIRQELDMCWGLYLSGEGEAGNRDELLDNLIHQCSLCSVAEPLCLPPQASTCGHTFLSPIPLGT